MRWKRFALAAMFLVGSVVDARSGSRSLLNQIEDEIATILETNRAGVVRIHTLYSDAGEDDGLQLGKAFTHGTGFIFDKRGYVVTIEGAVRGATQILVRMSSGKQVRATYVASDPVSEVAVIRLEDPPADVPVLPLGNSDKMRIGHFAFVLGNTFGTLSPSFGTVDDIHRDRDLLQIRASVHPGYGGAPVFCSTGEVIGMVWAEPDLVGSPEESAGLIPWMEKPSTVLLIPINRAIRIAKRLVDDGGMAYGGLGVEVEQRERGVLVTWVQPGGPAFHGGWQKGDLILSYDGRPIAGAYHLRRMVNETPPGTSAMVEIERANTPKIVSVTVGEMTGDVLRSAEGAFIGPLPDAPARRIASLEHELGGLRILLELGPVGSAPIQRTGSGVTRPEVVSQIDQLEREIGRLRRKLNGQ